MDFFRSRQNEQEVEYDPYLETFGERLDVESLLSIRDMEDTLIDLGHLSDTDRHPVPGYLVDEWHALTGPNESFRVHGSSEEESRIEQPPAHG